MKEYPYIRAWCQMLGSFPYYVELEITRATADRAPETAIYQNIDGTWATFEEIQSPITKQAVQAIVDGMEDVT